MVCKGSHVVAVYQSEPWKMAEKAWTAILVPIASAVCLDVVFAVEFELVFS